LDVSARCRPAAIKGISAASEFLAKARVAERQAESAGAVLGSAYMEPQSLICARLFAPGEQRPLDERLFRERLDAALAGREAAFDRPFYRLVYGDSDTLPGVVIDRFGDYLVVQFNNEGIERHRAGLLAALVAQLQPRGILLRGDSRSRREQGLPGGAEVVHGEVPQQVALEENGVHFLAPVHAGQKTGWFYDHRMSRARLAAWVAGKSVLDVYSYIGGWGIQAAAFGAAQVCCLDSSAAALEGVLANAPLNGLQDRVTTLRGSAPETMADLHARGSRFDVVILDPPKFAHSQQQVDRAARAYKDINLLGMHLLRPGGVLAAFSCSGLVSADLFQKILFGASVDAGRTVQVIERLSQGPDHPLLLSFPEGDYLKGLVCRVW